METLKLTLFLTVLAVLGSAGVLHLWGGGDGQYREEGLARIAGSPTEVFEQLWNPDQRPSWVSGLESSSASSWGAIQVGMELTESYEGRIEDVVWTVEACEEGRLLVLCTERDEVDLSLRYELKTNTSGRESLVTLTLEAGFEGFWPTLAEPVLGGQLFREFRDQLDALNAASS